MSTPINSNSQTVLLACTDSSGSTRLKIPSNALNASNMVLANTGSNAAFIKSGDASSTVAFPTSSGAAGTLIPAGAIMTVAKNSQYDTHILGVCASGESASVYVQFGNGI